METSGKIRKDQVITDRSVSRRDPPSSLLSRTHLPTSYIVHIERHVNLTQPSVHICTNLMRSRNRAQHNPETLQRVTHPREPREVNTLQHTHVAQPNRLTPLTHANTELPKSANKLQQRSTDASQHNPGTPGERLETPIEKIQETPGDRRHRHQDPNRGQETPGLSRATAHTTQQSRKIHR
jgi:hypothetical protein